MASSVFDKLNLKEQPQIVVLDAPPSFEPALQKLRGRTVKRQLQASDASEFVLVFATRKAEVDALAPRLAKAVQGDAILWFAYPKGTSKRYTCDFNRDTGWDGLRRLGFETVRQVAIDEDWSALRFRRQEFVSRAPGTTRRSGQATRPGRKRQA